MISEENIQNFKSFINKHNSFIIVGHKEPDGDCISSCLGMVSLLKKLNKESILISAGPFKRNETKKYEALFQKTLPPSLPENTGLIILDCSSQDRLGEVNINMNVFDTFIVDHHKTAGTSSKNSIINPKAPAAAYLVQLLYEAVHQEVDEETAKILFFGLCTDTGFFRFLETDSSEIFHAAARLVQKGANPKEAYSLMTGGKAFSTRKLLGILLSRAEQYFDGKLVITYETLEETELYGQNGRDSDALYQSLLAVEGVEAVVNIKQDTEDTCTAGLRSRDAVDVSIVASKFGGGGHKNASGLSYQITIQEFIPLLLEEFKKIFNK